MRFLKSKFFIVLVAVLLFISGFALYSVTLTDGTAVGNMGKEVAVFFKSCLNSVGGFFANAFDGLFNYGNVVKQNEEYRERINELERELIKNSDLLDENERLKNLLGIVGEDKSYIMVEACAVSKADGDWFSVFTVNKGKSDGVKTGDTVVTPDGLVGIVGDVGLNWAMVVSIIDTDSSIGGLVLRTGDAAVLKGEYSLMKQGLCRLSFISDTAVISRGDSVYTSGLGGVVPSGIKIGVIKEIYFDEQGVSYYAVVQPSVDFASIKNVYIITGEKAPEDVKDETD